MPRDRRWPAEHGLRAAAVAVRLGEIVGDGRRARGWLLRLANAEFDGNLSALVTDFAEEARRRIVSAVLDRSVHDRDLRRSLSRAGPS